MYVFVAATLSSLPARRKKWCCAASAIEEPSSLVTVRVLAPSSPDLRMVSRTSWLSPDWLMPTTSTPSRFILLSKSVKVEGEARAVGTPSSTSNRYLAYNAALSEVPRAAIITDLRPPSRKTRDADDTSSHPSSRIRSRTSGCSRISADILLPDMALTLPVVYGLAMHDGLLYRTLRAEDDQIGIGPRLYSSFFEHTQYLGWGLGSHSHGIFQGAAHERHAVAYSLIHGQRAAGQGAVGEANGAVLETNPAPAELVLAFGHSGCFHGVGNKSQALRALSLVGEA